MGFFTVPRITWGPGALEQLGALDAHRVLVTADPRVAELSHFVRVREELTKSGAQVEVTVCGAPAPTPSSVEALAEVLRQRSPDWIVAVGGGSTIDATRAAWVRWGRPDVALSHLSPLVELNLRSRAHLVAVPTTIGSGSEVSWQAHVWADDGALLEIASRELVPDWALLDPTFPTSLPPAIAADGAAELLGQAAEALQSEWANPFSNAMATEALALAADHLPRLGRRADDDTWASLQYASTLAGMAVANASAGNAHALAQALAPETGLAHGRLVGIILPYVVDFNFPSARGALQRAGAVLGPSTDPRRGTVAGRFRELLTPLGIPETVGAAGVDPERVLPNLGRVVRRAMASTAARANPRVASEAEWETLVRRVLGGSSEVDTKRTLPRG